MLKHTTSWRASVASETVLGVDNAKSGICYWRASEASETLSGVTQSRFRYIYLLASERSERDTYRGNTIENRGCLFIYLYIWTYVCHFVL